MSCVGILPPPHDSCRGCPSRIVFMCVADVDMDADCDCGVRGDRNDHRDHEARLILSRAGSATILVAPAQTQPPAPPGRAGSARPRVPRRAPPRSATAPMGQVLLARVARLSRERGGRRREYRRRRCGGGPPCASANARWRASRPNRPPNEPAVTDVITPAPTRRSSIEGSRWKAGQRSGWASTTRRSPFSSASSISSRCGATGVKGGSTSSHGPRPRPRHAELASSSSVICVRAISAPGRTSTGCPSAVITSSEARRSFNSATRSAIVAASLW